MLVVVGILLILFLAAADLMRPDSILRGAWRKLTRQETPLERVLQPIRQHDVSISIRDDPVPFAPPRDRHRG